MNEVPLHRKPGAVLRTTSIPPASAFRSYSHSHSLSLSLTHTLTLTLTLTLTHRDSVLEEELGGKAEPTVYSIDRGGTLCCWLADRSCSQNVIGWTPSVQVWTLRAPNAAESRFFVRFQVGEVFVGGGSL